MFDLNSVRSQFPSLLRKPNNNPITFLDGPGGTQVPDGVINAISDYYKTSNANTHGEFITTHETDVVIANMRTAMPWQYYHYNLRNSSVHCNKMFYVLLCWGADYHEYIQYIGPIYSI